MHIANKSTSKLNICRNQKYLTDFDRNAQVFNIKEIQHLLSYFVLELYKTKLFAI